MRALAAALAALLLAPALVNASGSVRVDLLVDGGTFSYSCENLLMPSSASAKDALEACRAARGFSTAYAFGGCFLDGVDGQQTLVLDPFYLLLVFWHFRLNGLAATEGICATPVAEGQILTFGYEPGSAWVPNGAAPLPYTAAWIALHLA